MVARVLVYRSSNLKFGRDNRRCNVDHILFHRQQEVANLKKMVASMRHGSLEIKNKDVYEMMCTFLRQEKMAHYHYAKRKENVYKIKFDKRIDELEAL